MAARDVAGGDVGKDATLVDELFDTITASSVGNGNLDPAGLVEAMAYLGMVVNEEQVREAMMKVLLSLDAPFTKVTFMQLVELLRSESTATDDSTPGTSSQESAQ